MARQPWMRRFDFDTEAVVRLAWRGVKPDQHRRAGEVPAAPKKAASRTSTTGATTLLLTWMHTRLMLEFVLRLPLLVVATPGETAAVSA